MRWMKRNWLSLFLLAGFSLWMGISRAQTTAGLPSQITVSGLHTACTLSPVTVPASASYCYAGDGLWVSVNGAAYTQLGLGVASGVTSIAVCNLAVPAVCGLPLTGAVSLAIPKTVTEPAQSVTVPALTLTLQ
jgi:hypothetical protein